MLSKIIAVFAKLLPLQKAIACVAATAVVAAGGAAAVTSVRSFVQNNSVGVGDTLLSVDAEKPDYEPFEAFSFGSMKIVQLTGSTYDIEVSFDGDEAGDEFEFYISRFDTFDSGAVVQPHTLSDGVYSMDNVQLDFGEYYLYAVYGEQQAVTHFDIPNMQPKIWMNGDIPNIEFEIDGNISWGSFIDNEGKNVYRSSSPVFDESAVLLSGNMNILESSFIDSNPNAEQPYYYLVLTGKNGSFTYITAPLFYKAEQSELEAEFTLDGGEPHLILTGSLWATIREAERSMSLRVGNFNWDNPASTFMVENSSDGDDAAKFRFDVPLSLLKDETNDLSLFLKENGTTLEWSIQAQNLDLSSLRLEADGAAYGLTRPESLQITKTVNAFGGVSATLYNDANGIPYMTINGTVRDSIGEGGEDYELVVKMADGESFTAENTADGRSINFVFGLNQLNEPDVWYDIELHVKSEDRYYNVLYTEAAGETDSLQTANRLYSFQEWENILKISYELKREFVNVSSSLELVNGKPVLRVTGGSASPLEVSDFFMAVRNGDTLLTSENLATNSGYFSFEFDLTRLGERYVWYDTLIGIHSDGDRLYDLSSDHADDMEKSITSDDIEYRLREWDGDLKVEAQYAASIYKDISVRLVKENDEPVLLVTGNVRYLNNKDVYLGMRTGETILKVINDAAAGETLNFRFDLTKLNQSDVWYDLVLFNTQNEMSASLRQEAADLDEEVSHRMYMYKFAEYEGDLKVYRAPNSEFAQSVSASIRMDDGTPTLVVDGITDFAKYKDIYLAVRSGNTVYETKNDAGEDNFVDIRFDLTELTRAGVWYDVMLGDKSSGVLVSLTTDSADMDETLKYENARYKFEEYEDDLKLTFSYDFADTVSAELIMENGKPVMKLEGDLSNIAKSNAYLRVKSDSKEYTVNNTATDTGKYLFKFDLTQLSKKDTWYDIEIGDRATKTFASIPDSTVDMSQKVSYNSRQYQFADWNGELKVYYSADTSYLLSASAHLSMVSSVPTLVVTGTTKDVLPQNLYLAIRTGSQILRAVNETSVANSFLFNFPLSNLSASDTWYDVLVGNSATGALADVSSIAGDLSASLTDSNRVYQFEDYNGCLKVYYTNQLVEITSVSFDGTNGAKLVVEGTMSGFANDDVYLRAYHSKDGETFDIDFDNEAVNNNEFLFEFDLTQIPDSKVAEWIALRIGVTSLGTETDILDSDDYVDADARFYAAGRSYYFEKNGNALKIVFDNALTSVRLANIGGLPRLIMEGAMEDMPDENIYLRIYNDQNGTTYDETVANSSTDPDTFLFVYDLWEMIDAKEGNWIDLYIVSPLAGTSDEIRASGGWVNWDELSGTNRKYFFVYQNWGATRLKLIFEDHTSQRAYDATSSKIVFQDGGPKLIVEGTLNYVSPGDFYLRLYHEKDGYAYEDFAYNSLDSSTNFKCTFDLTQLPDGKKWEWIGIYMAVKNIEQREVWSGTSDWSSLEHGGRNYYFTAEDGWKLRIVFEDASSADPAFLALPAGMDIAALSQESAANDETETEETEQPPEEYATKPESEPEIITSDDGASGNQGDTDAPQVDAASNDESAQEDGEL